MMIKGASSATFVRRAAIASLFVTLACVVHVGSRDVVLFAAIALAVGLGWVGSMWRYDQKLWSLSQRIEAISGRGHQNSVADRLEENAEGLEIALAAMKHRLTERHPLSGLPTREPLLFRMEEDRHGLLGALAVADFERLAGFDPAMAERVLLNIVSRILRMVPTERLIAHVDRAQFVIWYGPEIDPALARSEIDAIAYALGSIVTAEGREILPTIATRCASLSDGSAPPALLAQTLASFAIPTGSTNESRDLSPASIAQEEQRYGLEQDLRTAIMRNEFDLAFQPLIDTTLGNVIGAEALIRWEHPVRGMVSPAIFIPVVEAAGLAEDVGLWVLNAAAREASHWQASGAGAIRVAVNISANQLHSPKFTECLKRTLHNHALDPGNLEIELTEGVASTNDAELVRMFDEIRALGIRIAIDDFGTGYSSFSTLRQLNFDKIKIDREFITKVDRRPQSQAICQSIIALGRGLNIRVLAEGVESASEYRWLLDHGCTHFQGFYFSPPLSPADFLAFVNDREGLGKLLRTGPRSRFVERTTA